MKRIFDVVVAGGSLLVFAPFLILVALAVLVTSGRPVFYSCESLGHRGRRFTLYKFRTMVRNAEAMKAELVHLNEVQGPAFKMRDDPRVTPLGRILRRYSVDELPQLWNVVRGEMLGVGPRPILPEQRQAMPSWAEARFQARPGLTGLAQVEGRRSLGWLDQLRWDVTFVEEERVGLRLRILLRTLGALRRTETVYGEAGKNWRAYLPGAEGAEAPEGPTPEKEEERHT
jgi:lipopolysaccharide/colanic/teichoic acid biosynthesis glycosyltransferase